MGNSQSMQKINFEDIKTILKNPETTLLINTLLDSEQTCLILNTVPASKEEEIINKCLTMRSRNIQIVIYGKNCNDDKIYTKYSQLTSLGFNNIYLYVGGMFEWLMLQDIYGFEEFPTTIKHLDFLKYKPSSILHIGLIGY